MLKQTNNDEINNDVLSLFIANPTKYKVCS